MSSTGVILVGGGYYDRTDILALLEKLDRQVVVYDEAPRTDRWPSRYMEELLRWPPPAPHWANEGFHFGDPWNGTWDQRAVRILRRQARLMAPVRYARRPAVCRRARPTTPRGRRWSHIDYGRRLGRKR